MKILLASDTHGHSELLYALTKIHPDCDFYLHAGDLCDYEVNVFPFIVCKGNCDFDENLMEKRLIVTPYGKLLMTHIPMNDEKYLIKNNIKIYVFGHLHKRCFKKIDDIYYVSPGSLCFERDKYGEGYCILDISNDDVKVTFYDL